MRHLFSKPKLLSALTVTCLLLACNKSELITPPATAQSTNADEAITNATISPGIYKITRFVDNGRNETAEFNRYVFNFKANGVLIARTNEGERVQGTWTLNNNGTRLEIKISGKDALDGIDDDDWRVVNISATEISLRTSDPNRVVFTMTN